MLFRDDARQSPCRVGAAGRHRDNTSNFVIAVWFLTGGGGGRVCMARMPLHGHAVDAIHTGQLDSDGVPSWSVRLPTPASVAPGGR